MRSAQDRANLFHRKTLPISATAFKIYTGTIQKNIASLKTKTGMVFIMNGWGSTDHIDLWRGNGVSGTLKGGTSSGPNTYLDKGAKTWFWEFE